MLELSFTQPPTKSERNNGDLNDLEILSQVIVTPAILDVLFLVKKFT